jgi:Protein of unknown function (DUF2690)
MDIIRQLTQSMNFVKSPLTLIAFLVVSAIAALLLILKYTNGLEMAQRLLLKGASLKHGELVKIINRVLFVVLMIVAMLFTLLAYDIHASHIAEKEKIEHGRVIANEKAEQERIRTDKGIPCQGDTCNGKNPQQLGCAVPTTPTIGVADGSYLVEGKMKDVRVQLRYSPLCRAVWVKATKVAGAKIWVESESKQPLTDPYTIPNSKVTDDHHTDMWSGEVKSRGCFQVPGTEPLCTGYVQP